ncbi:hypothetical protein F2Q69_00019784 [Brassica cretica]|uniref:HMA domain-containing protein n=1 Tax=Brassica cretica TaxID=69181 RepID=A0A8S9Q315_BRACR|nr:hypothetical protein F2Q69_00019784 [Brassica cretica]
MDDKTGKMTVVGEVDVPVIVKKLRKICNAELVTVEVVKPPEKKPEPEKPTPDKPAEIVAFPVTQFNNPYQYHYSYANSYYQPCDNYRVVVEEPNTCVVIASHHHRKKIHFSALVLPHLLLLFWLILGDASPWAGSEFTRLWCYLPHRWSAVDSPYSSWLSRSSFWRSDFYALLHSSRTIPWFSDFVSSPPSLYVLSFRY